MDLPDTLAQRFEQGGTPAVRSERSGFLVGLFIRLGQEFHRRVRRIDVLFDGYHEFDVAFRLVFLYGEVVQLAQLIGWILLSMVPFSQCRSSPAKPNYTAERRRGLPPSGMPDSCNMEAQPR